MSAGGWKAKPVAFCSLTESGRVEYFGGRPMFIAGPVGNYLYPVALYPHPDPVRAALVEALKQTWKVIDSAGLLNLSNGVELGQTSWYGKARDARAESDAALKAAGEGL